MSPVLMFAVSSGCFFFFFGLVSIPCNFLLKGGQDILSNGNENK